MTFSIKFSNFFSAVLTLYFYVTTLTVLYLLDDWTFREECHGACFFLIWNINRLILKLRIFEDATNDPGLKFSTCSHQVLVLIIARERHNWNTLKWVVAKYLFKDNSCQVPIQLIRDASDSNPPYIYIYMCVRGKWELESEESRITIVWI